MVMLTGVSREAKPGTGRRFDRSRIKALMGISIIVGCLATMFYVFSRPSRNEIGPEHDFVTIIAGAHCAIDRCDPYDSPTLEREFPKMGGYIPPLHFKPEWPVYPPSTLFVLLPLSLLNWPALSVVWMVLCFGFLCAAFVVLLLRFNAYRDVLSFLPLGILLADAAIGQAVQLGQPTLLAGSALTLAIIALESGSMPVTGGLLLALSLCLKPQGAFFCGIYFLLRSRTRIPALAAYVFTAAAGLGGILLFYYRLSSLAYLGHLSSNLKLAFQPGRDADFSPLNEYSPSFLNLQAFLARLVANPQVCNALTYAVCLVIVGLLVFVCWRKKNLSARPFTILAVLVMLELLVSYHRFYDHIFMLAALPGLYEIKQRGKSGYLLSVGALFVYLFRQFHDLKIHGLGPFPSGAPVELFIALVCLHSLWSDDSQAPSHKTDSSPRIDVAHPGPVAAHERVAGERDPDSILAPIDQVPLVGLERIVPGKLPSGEGARSGVAKNQTLVGLGRLSRLQVEPVV
jgi:hypothetical protein